MIWRKMTQDVWKLSTVSATYAPENICQTSNFSCCKLQIIESYLSEMHSTTMSTATRWQLEVSRCVFHDM